MMTRPPQVGQANLSCLAIFRPQSGHQTSSSLRAMKIDCQTPTCFLGLHASHSDIVIRVTLNAHAASSFHLLTCSSLSSHVLWKKLLWPSWLNEAETGSSLSTGLPQTAQFSMSLDDSTTRPCDISAVLPKQSVPARTQPTQEISKRQEDPPHKQCTRALSRVSCCPNSVGHPERNPVQATKRGQAEVEKPLQDHF